MKTIAKFVAVAVLATSSVLANADAGDLNIFHAIDIDASADQVWAVAGNFGGIQRWSPGTESSRLVLHDRETRCEWLRPVRLSNPESSAACRRTYGDPSAPAGRPGSAPVTDFLTLTAAVLRAEVERPERLQ